VTKLTVRTKLKTPAQHLYILFKLSLSQVSL